MHTYDPENIAPLAAYLASDDAAKINGRVFHIVGGNIELMKTGSSIGSIKKDAKWTVEELTAQVPDLIARSK